MDALKLTHIDKVHYPSAEFHALNVLERCKLKLNQEADRRGEPIPTPTRARKASAVATGATSGGGDAISMISELTSTVSTLASAVKSQKDDLNDFKQAAKRALQQGQDQHKEEESEEYCGNRSNEALVRGHFKKPRT